MKGKTVDMTQGNISAHMLKYAVPLVLTNILQLTYNAVDSIIVGRFVGNEAQAAIGIANPLMNVLIYFISGSCTGIAVLISEFFGAGDHAKLKKEMGTAAKFGGCFFLGLALLCFILAPFLLGLINTPPEILGLTTAYVRTVLCGILFVFTYNLYSCALRGVGNVNAPLVFLGCSTTLNIFLDILFVMVLKAGVLGAALGTVISQGVACLLCMFYVNTRVEFLRIGFRDLRITPSLLSSSLNYAVSTGSQKIVLMVGKLLVQGLVNPLGVDVIAAFNAVNRVDDFVFEPGQSIGAAITTMIAQNRGAKKAKRIRRAFPVGLLMEFVYWLIIGPIVWFCAPAIMSLFSASPDNVMIGLGVTYLHIMAFLYIMPDMTNGIQGYVRGFGQMNVALASTTVQLIVRVATACIVIPRFGMSGIAYCMFFGWSAMLLFEIPYVWCHRKTKFSLPNA